MKKILFCLLLTIAGMVATGCQSCKSENKVQELTDSLVSLVAENTISADREYMAFNYADWRWFETSITLKDYLDEECDGAIDSIANVFQYIIEIDSTSADVNVVIFNYNSNGGYSREVIPGFWVGDGALNDSEIRITYKEAFDKMMQTNYPKPHSRHCVLRREVGAMDNNPQYIFGNTKAQLYVDAVTGEVSEDNPAYMGKPLGEWP